MKQKNLRASLALLILSLGFLLLPVAPTAVAAVLTYDPTNPNDVWDLTTVNWNGSTVPWTNGNQAVFGGTGETVQLSGAIAATNSGATYAIQFTTSGYTLADGDNDATLTLGSASAGNMIQGTNATGTNTISENITFAGGGIKVINQASGGTLVLSGNISEAVAGTALSLTGSGGIFTLSGNNGYTGNTTMASGTILNLNNAGALGTGNLVLSGSATIDNTSGSAITLNNNGLTLSGGSLTFTGTNNLSFGNGVLTLTTANRTITTTAGVLTINGGIVETGSRQLTKAGAGTLVLGGAGTYTGGTVISGGTLRVANASALGAAGSSVTVSAASTLQYAVDGAVNAYNLTYSALSGTNTYNLLLDRATPGAAINQSISSLNIGGGSTGTNTLNVSAGSNVTSGTPVLSIASVTGPTTARTTHLAGNATFNIGTVTAGSSASATTGTIFFEGTSGANQVTSTMSDNSSGGGLSRLAVNINASGGTWTFSGSNSYTGNTIISAGSLVAAADGALGGGNVSLTGTAISLTLQGGATQNYIADSATLSIAIGNVNLNYTGTDSITALVINGVNQAAGQYGAPGSGAMFENAVFTGTGFITVIPEPSTWAMLVLGAGMLLGFQRVRRRA